LFQRIAPIRRWLETVALTEARLARQLPNVVAHPEDRLLTGEHIRQKRLGKGLVIRRADVDDRPVFSDLACAVRGSGLDRARSEMAEHSRDGDRLELTQPRKRTGAVVKHQNRRGSSGSFDRGQRSRSGLENSRPRGFGGLRGDLYLFRILTAS